MVEGAPYLPAPTPALPLQCCLCLLHMVGAASHPRASHNPGNGPHALSPIALPTPHPESVAYHGPVLSPQSVNELLESANAPLEIVDGFIESISVAIPWAALVTENCTVEVTGLQVTCRPKDRTGKG